MRGEAGPRRRVPWLRWATGLLSAAAVVGCIALLIVLILMPGCNSASLYVIAVPEYTDESLPPNPFAAADSGALGALPSFKTVSEAPVRVDLSKWLSESSGREAAVIYVNMLGGRDGRGSFLFPSDAGPDDSANFVPLDALWEALRSPELRRRKKLLLLDLARIESDGRLGLIENRVLDEIEAGASTVESLVVLCSCRPDETSWTSADLGPNGHSAFAHFVARGLAGEADRSENNRVSVAELFEYVHVSTRNWAIQNRDPNGQHPWLIPSADKLGDGLNFTVVTVRDGKSPPAGARSAGAFTEALAKLHALWEARDRLREAEAWRSDPLRWRQLEFRLSRAEEWLLARNERRAERLLEEARRTHDALRQTDAIAELQSHPFVYENIGRRVLGQPPKATRPELPEMHLEALLKRDLPVPQNAEAVGRAVATRRLAEEAASGPLGTHPWVAAAVASGDAHRRAGEDLLLAGESRRENALAELGEAEQHYRQAISIGQTVEAAERLSQRLLAELPALADWASFRRASAERRGGRSEGSTRGAAIARYVAALSGSDVRRPDVAELEALLRDTGRESPDALEVEILMSFSDARDLQRRLDPARSSPDEIAQLRDRTGQARERLQSLITRLETHARQLATNLAPAQPQQVHRTEVRNALNWRYLPADVRRDLIRKLIEFERGMNERTEEVGQEDWKISIPEIDGEAAGARALWHGLWAVHSATLGEPDAASVEKLWLDWKACAQHQNDPAEQRELFVRLGDGVRQTWLAKRQAIRSRAGAGPSGPDGYRAALVEADRLARSVHGYDAEHLAGEHPAGSVDPAKLLRDYDLAELCLANAERYADDFYAAVGGGSSAHWYEQAAQQCLGAAQQRLRGLAGAPLSGRAGAIDSLLRERRQARLQLRPTAAVEFGLAQRREFELGVERDGKVPDGTAVLWLEQSPGNELTIDGDREAIATAGGTAAFWAAKSGAFDESNCRPEAVRPQLLFRGHRWGDDQIPLNACRPTGTFVSYAPPGDTGSVVVEGTDRRPIMFVLDCSFSMDNNEQGIRTFGPAVDTLKKTLQRMAVLDPPHQVGLIAYGHRVRYSEGQIIPNEDWRKDGTEIPRAVLLDPLLDYETLSDVQPLTAGHLRDLEKSLERLKSWGNTPLLGAILMAGKRLEESGGLIVAVSDGAYQDTKLLDELKAYLKEQPQVQLYLVGFNVPAPVAAVLAPLAGQNFVQAPNPAALAASLERAIKPRRFEVSPRGPGAAREQELDRPIDGLPAGPYRVRFAEAPPVPFQIAGGERLVFAFDQKLGRLRHVKGATKLSKSAEGPGGISEGDPDSLGYRRFKMHDGRAEFILVLQHERNEFPVRRPEEISLDVRPQGTGERRSHEIRSEPDQSVPAWNVVVHDWPAGHPAEVHAFWKLQRTAPDLQLGFETLGEKPIVRLPTEDQASVRVSGVHEGTVVRLEVKAAASDSRVADLADLRVELGEQGFQDEFKPHDLPYRCEYFADEQTLIFEFPVGEDFDPERAVVGITTLASRRSGSVGLPQPLVLPKHDDQL